MDYSVSRNPQRQEVFLDNKLIPLVNLLQISWLKVLELVEDYLDSNSHNNRHSTNPIPSLVVYLVSNNSNSLFKEELVEVYLMLNNNSNYSQAVFLDSNKIL